MEKLTGLVILIVGAGIFLYLLPFLAPFLGVDSSVISGSSDSVFGQIIILNNENLKSENAIWHSSLKPDIFEIQNSPFDNSVLYAATSRGLFISRDRGKNWYSWSDLEKKIEGAFIYKIVFDKNISGKAFISMFKNMRGYVYETKDSFFSLNQVFDSGNNSIYDLELVHSDLPNGQAGLSAGRQDLLLGLSDGRILSYSPGTKEFRPLANFGSAVYDIKSANSHLYITTKSNGIFVRVGGLGEFTSLASGAISGESLKSVAVEEKTGSPLYAASLNSAFSSFNSGLGWNGVKTILGSSEKIDFVVLSPSGELYLVSGQKVYRSKDSGQGWQIVFNLADSSADASKRKVSGVYFSQNDRIIIGTKS